MNSDCKERNLNLVCQAYDIYSNFDYKSSGKLNDLVEYGVHVL